LQGRRHYRSSSGARATYARLYGGLPCRNGSEMAYRFNYADRYARSGECPFERFPRVTPLRMVRALSF
ncbi:hypothetical protein, partial [Comamonas sp. JC664]|uniref:hypothetical protein n=1 Tax=Comamonas sp. JC664 TaxID=2801917 RepID=UPI003622D055